MAFNESHPIRATIKILWKEKYKQLKQDYENKLKSNCEIYQNENRKKEVLKHITNSYDFYDKYDVIGEIKCNTPKSSYIIKEQLDPLRTSFDLFNDKEHIKEAVKFVKNLLKETIRENRSGLKPFSSYKFSVVYSLNNVPFQTPTFKSLLLRNIPILLGWFLVPITQIADIYFNNKININTSDLSKVDLPTAIQITVSNINKIQIVVSFIIIIAIYLIATYSEWRQKQNVIRF
jgi:hypothetical protein